MRTRGKLITVVALALGVLPLVACGSDRAGTSTSPTSVTAPAGASSANFRANDHGGTENESVEGEGVITALTTGTACPTLSFSIGSKVISVTAATILEHGVCTDLQVGTRVEAKGTMTGDHIVATRIQIKLAEHPVEGEGVITALTTGTACPTLSFSIGSKLVSVTAAMILEHGVCTDLQVGTRVEAKGTMTGDHIVATRIKIKNEDPLEEVEGEDRVSSLVAGSACPTLKFMVEESTVTLTASTTFVNGLCTDIAVGKRVGVKGSVTAHHQVLATRVVFK